MSSWLFGRTYYESKSFISCLQSLNFEIQNELSGILWQSLNTSQNFDQVLSSPHLLIVHGHFSPYPANVENMVSS